MDEQEIKTLSLNIIDLLNANGVDLVYHICAGDKITIQMLWKSRKFKLVVNRIDKTIEIIFNIRTRYSNYDTFSNARGRQITVVSLGDINNTLNEFINGNKKFGINSISVVTYIYVAGKILSSFVIEAKSPQDVMVL